MNQRSFRPSCSFLGINDVHQQGSFPQNHLPNAKKDTPTKLILYSSQPKNPLRLNSNLLITLPRHQVLPPQIPLNLQAHPLQSRPLARCMVQTAHNQVAQRSVDMVVHRLAHQPAIGPATDPGSIGVVEYVFRRVRIGLDFRREGREMVRDERPHDLWSGQWSILMMMIRRRKRDQTNPANLVSVHPCIIVPSRIFLVEIVEINGGCVVPFGAELLRREELGFSTTAQRPEIRSARCQ